MLATGLHDIIPFDRGVHRLLLAIHDRDDDLSWLSTLSVLHFGPARGGCILESPQILQRQDEK